MSSAIELTIEPRRRPVGSGMVDRLLPFRERRTVGPFIFADRMGPADLDAGSRVDVDAHPHIGLSTVTYLFAGRMVHRDSTGVVQTIEPGAVNWMTAGSGVTHTERSHPDDVARPRAMHGLQTWVALPDDAQDVAPSFDHTPADAVPVERVGASGVRLAVGTGWGHQAPVSVSSPLVLAEVDLAPDDPVPVATPHPEIGVIAVAGHVAIDDDALPTGHLAVLGTNRQPSLTGEGTAVVIGGEPVGPRHIWWNFVHRDPERIEAAKADWTAQRFPTVPDDHDPWVPLPPAS